MIQFLIKGILRDKNRSILPIIIITIGVTLTVLLSAYMKGALGGIADENARFDTGHVKVMTRAYEENKAQLPNDLAILEVDELVQKLEQDFPDVQWVKRTRFGGLLDFPDAEGNSKGQGPVLGTAINLLDASSGEVERMQIEKSIVRGSLPKSAKEALVGDSFADKLGIKIGDEVTFFGTTMNGSMTFFAFQVSGTIRYGSAALDKGAMLIDITAAQEVLDMENGSGEVLGYLKEQVYLDDKAFAMAQQFNAEYATSEDEFAPIMQSLKQQNNLAEYLDYADSASSLFVSIFVFAMSIVLWNTGLLGGLRRYKEFGIRLALGEPKGTIYRRLILEAALIGIIGSTIGTIIGLTLAYYVQVNGIDISKFLENSSMLMPTVLRTKVTPELFYIGFIPGVFAMVLGNMLSGLGIYKRETASLFKELEV